MSVLSRSVFLVNTQDLLSAGKVKGGCYGIAKGCRVPF